MFFLVSLWHFGKVNAQGSEEAITLVLDTGQTQVSPFAKINKPKFYKPLSLTILKSGVAAATVVPVSLDQQNRLGAPESYADVGWFKDGVKPGESGNAIFDGHYDKKDGSPAVFYKLGKLAAGDVVGVVDEVGRELNFQVFDVSLVSVSDPISVQRAFADSDTPVITLITCGGVWSVKEQNYSKRLLVKAKLI